MEQPKDWLQWNKYEKRANLPIGAKQESKDAIRIVAKQIVSEKQLLRIDSAPIPQLASEQLFVCNVVAGIPGH